jgi:hypothetical protein
MAMMIRNYRWNVNGDLGKMISFRTALEVDANLGGRGHFLISLPHILSGRQFQKARLDGCNAVLDDDR